MNVNISSKQHQSLIVGSKYGRRSEKWIISVSGRDVVVSGESFSDRFHVTLHERGKWHFRSNKPRSGLPKFIVESHRDFLPANEYKVGLYIVIPDCALHQLRDITAAEKAQADVWLENPPYGGAIEISIIEYDWTKLKRGVEAWPGQSAGTHMLLVYRMAETTGLFVLCRVLAADHPISIEAAESRPNFAPGVNPAQGTFVIVSKNAVGSLLLIEHYIE